MAEKAFTSKPKSKKKKKKNAQAAVPQGVVRAAVVRPQGGVKKPIGKCFLCKQKGHWKKDCPCFLNRPNNGGKFHLLVVETCLAVRSTGTWCVDSGATNHVCNTLQEF